MVGVEGWNSGLEQISNCVVCKISGDVAASTVNWS